MTISRLLIANRGEIAMRILKTAQRLGVPTVAIFTAGDAEALHVRQADEAVGVTSYLDIEAVVEAALATGATAVHPGYGFLSERSAFASALEAAGLTLVGPSAAVMEQMGRKDLAREVAVAAGVPVVPSSPSLDLVETIGYPVLVKAAAGGGGKGMRIVRTEAELGEAMAGAKREALSAFGDDTMLIEKYVERGRHIEVQVLGDSHGTVLHLGERDCSAQRRHQKVIEEAPAPTLHDAVRDRIRRAAVDLASQVGYTNAGTVEFLLDEDSGDFYFLEMNTRLQVEHPVTEAITGLDLVELQLLVADGQPLPLTQDDVRFTGHAIEARLYAEDAFGGFLPQAGTATHVRWPDIADVRVDHALESGQVITTAFDPMLAKVIVHAADRELARGRLMKALDRMAIFGLTTNAGYLYALLDSEEFRDARVDTAWLDHHALLAPPEEAAHRLAGLVLDDELGDAPREPFMPDRFRMAAPPGRLVEHGRDLTPGPWGEVSSTVGDTAGPIRVANHPDGHGYVLRGRDATEVVHLGQRFVLSAPDLSREGAVAGGGAVVSPMPGTVLDVRVAVGDEVAEGDVLGVMEAMKMEHALKAPFAGTVTTVGTETGASVALGATMFVVALRDGSSLAPSGTD